MSRGTWTLDEAIETRWRDAGLDASFRAYWTDSTIMEYPTLSEGAAPAGAPGPYCVWQKGAAAQDGGDSGTTSTTGRKRWRVPVTFTVYAKNSTTLTGKARAKALAAIVATAFDWEYGYLSITTDSHVKTERITDYSTAEYEQDEYSWTLQYEITIEATETLPT